MRRVRMEEGSCTCEWWYDHRGSRGPCKHVLAARIAVRENVVEETLAGQETPA
nr:hypothetical protein GCM10020093_002520 [Planobispora longispora]